jgi:hypothetical protein
LLEALLCGARFHSEPMILPHLSFQATMMTFRAIGRIPKLGGLH